MSNFDFRNYRYDVESILEDIQEEAVDSVEAYVRDAIDEAFSYKDDKFESILEEAYDAGYENAREDFDDVLQTTVTDAQVKALDTVIEYLNNLDGCGSTIRKAVDVLESLNLDEIKERNAKFKEMPLRVGDEVKLEDGRRGVVARMYLYKENICPIEEKDTFYVLFGDGSYEWVAVAQRTGRHYVELEKILNELSDLAELE